MAEIFLARMVGVLGFDKLVVIKRILPHLAQRNDFIAMFLDEARIATTLNHANIVQTHEVGVHGKSYFMVMEYLAGEDARSIVRRIARDAAASGCRSRTRSRSPSASPPGCNYAHGKSDRDGKALDIVHRDVTPQNVIVTYDGAVKLLDFGIAKASNRINETRSGSFKGKVPYMSPEQCRGDALDRRSDIFSLGILLHEMTLCRRLFRGETDFQILKQIAEGPITRPRDVDPGYDARLSAIVMKALERDPARRFQTARELQEALESLGHDMRLRLSPLALADYMQALFGDKAGAWQKASAEGDVAQLERHFATVMAEREADLVSEEGEGEREPVAAVLPLPPSDVQLSSLPAEALLVPTRYGAARWLAALVVLAGGILGVWRFGAHRGDAAAGRDRTWPSRRRRSRRAASAKSGRSFAGARRRASRCPTGAPATAPADGRRRRRAPTRSSWHRRPRRAPRSCSTARRCRSRARPASTSPPARSTRSSCAAPGTPASRSASCSMPAKRRRWRSTSESAARPPSNGSLARATRALAAATPAPSAPRRRRRAAAPVKREGEGTLVIASSPWCTVTVDGQPRGTTPLNVKLKAGAARGRARQPRIQDQAHAIGGHRARGDCSQEPRLRPRIGWFRTCRAAQSLVDAALRCSHTEAYAALRCSRRLAFGLLATVLKPVLGRFPSVSP